MSTTVEIADQQPRVLDYSLTGVNSTRATQIRA